MLNVICLHLLLLDVTGKVSLCATLKVVTLYQCFGTFD